MGVSDKDLLRAACSSSRNKETFKGQKKGRVAYSKSIENDELVPEAWDTDDVDRRNSFIEYTKERAPRTCGSDGRSRLTSMGSSSFFARQSSVASSIAEPAWMNSEFVNALRSVGSDEEEDGSGVGGDGATISSVPKPPSANSTPKLSKRARLQGLSQKIPPSPKPPTQYTKPPLRRRRSSETSARSATSQSGKNSQPQKVKNRERRSVKGASAITKNVKDKRQSDNKEEDKRSAIEYIRGHQPVDQVVASKREKVDASSPEDNILHHSSSDGEGNNGRKPSSDVPSSGSNDCNGETTDFPLHYAPSGEQYSIESSPGSQFHKLSVRCSPLVNGGRRPRPAAIADEVEDRVPRRRSSSSLAPRIINRKTVQIAEPAIQSVGGDIMGLALPPVKIPGHMDTPQLDTPQEGEPVTSQEPEIVDRVVEKLKLEVGAALLGSLIEREAEQAAAENEVVQEEEVSKTDNVRPGDLFSAKKTRSFISRVEEEGEDGVREVEMAPRIDEATLFEQHSKRRAAMKDASDAEAKAKVHMVDVVNLVQSINKRIEIELHKARLSLDKSYEANDKCADRLNAPKGENDGDDDDFGFDFNFNFDLKWLFDLVEQSGLPLTLPSGDWLTQMETMLQHQLWQSRLANRSKFSQRMISFNIPTPDEFEVTPSGGILTNRSEMSTPSTGRGHNWNDQTATQSNFERNRSAGSPTDADAQRTPSPSSRHLLGIFKAFDIAAVRALSQDRDVSLANESPYSHLVYRHRLHEVIEQHNLSKSKTVGVIDSTDISIPPSPFSYNSRAKRDPLSSYFSRGSGSMLSSMARSGSQMGYGHSERASSSENGMLPDISGRPGHGMSNVPFHFLDKVRARLSESIETLSELTFEEMKLPDPPSGMSGRLTPRSENQYHRVEWMPMLNL